MSRKTLILSLTLLLSFGILSLGWTQWGPRVGRFDPEGPGPMMGPGPMALGNPAIVDALAKRLDLTEEQQAKLQKLAQDVQKETQAIRQALESATLDLRHLWQAESLDREAILGKTREIADLRGQLMEIATRYRLDVVQTLTPEQRTKLAQLHPFARGRRGPAAKHFQRGRVGHGPKRGMAPGRPGWGPRFQREPRRGPKGPGPGSWAR